MKKEYDFEKLNDFKKDMMLSFLVEDCLMNNELNDILNKISPQDKSNFYSIYGEDLSEDKILEKLKLEVVRLNKLENKNINEFIFYEANKIYNIQNQEKLSNQDLLNMKEMQNKAKDNNLYDFRVGMTYLYASKNKDDFNRIVEILNLKKSFTYFDTLFLKYNSSEQVQILFGNKKDEMIDLYMDSNYGLKNIKNLFELLINSSEKHSDKEFVRQLNKITSSFIKKNKVNLSRIDIKELKDEKIISLLLNDYDVDKNKELSEKVMLPLLNMIKESKNILSEEKKEISKILFEKFSQKENDLNKIKKFKI